MWPDRDGQGNSEQRVSGVEGRGSRGGGVGIVKIACMDKTTEEVGGYT